MSTSSDTVMQALAYPFDRDLAAMPDGGRILLANALPGAGPWAPARTSVWQWWKGPAAAFEGGGFTLVHGDLTNDAGADEKFNAVLLRLPRQREEAQFVMSSAWQVLAPGGLFMAAAANDAGGARLEKDLKPFLPGLQNASKHKCRIVWARKEAQALPQEWITRGHLQKHGEPGIWTRPGLFSWDRVDVATGLLLPFLPTGLKGAVADLGCGTGVIANHVLKHNPDVALMLCLDADVRAVEACRKNLAERHAGRNIDYHWVDLGQQIPPAQKFPLVDTVIMNPPFHAEKTLAIALGQAFIRNAAAFLKTGGSLWMVANAHLPYEPILQQTFKAVEKVHEGRGFKIIRAVK
ncbi:MAG: methyltransferase small domain protein [Micavibrio sp.]|nr:methyltransferase small domain protein [Micavibrio sp.]